MGEVYRARDTKLDRDVALKVLPEAFTQDPDRLARFEREAKVLASLNHPNIAAIYGLEEADGIRALVLELVEGPTLADRIAKGRAPFLFQPWRGSINALTKEPDTSDTFGYTRRAGAPECGAPASNRRRRLFQAFFLVVF